MSTSPLHIRYWPPSLATHPLPTTLHTRTLAESICGLIRSATFYVFFVRGGAQSEREKERNTHTHTHTHTHTYAPARTPAADMQRVCFSPISSAMCTKRSTMLTVIIAAAAAQIVCVCVCARARTRVITRTRERIHACTCRRTVRACTHQQARTWSTIQTCTTSMHMVHHRDIETHTRLADSELDLWLA